MVSVLTHPSLGGCPPRMALMKVEILFIPCSDLKEQSGRVLLMSPTIILSGHTSGTMRCETDGILSSG